MADQIVGVFSLGDAVTWTSQSGGYRKTKTGKIAQVVQPGEYPDRDRFPVLFSGSGVGAPRKETSYVVLVGGAAYWPRTKGLAPVDVPQIVGVWKKGPVPGTLKDEWMLVVRRCPFSLRGVEWQLELSPMDPDVLWYCIPSLPKEES